MTGNIFKTHQVTHIYAIPGNGGTELEEEVTNIKIDANNFEVGLVQYGTEFMINFDSKIWKMEM